MKRKRLLNERNVYFFFVLVALIPVCLTRYIGSLDGPVHLQVSNIMGGLFIGNNTMHDFFQLTPPIIGNITGAYLLALFNLILPSWQAEKLLILAYLIGFYASFRYFVKAINPKPGFLTLLIIPFAYNSLFLLGYYNFSLALVLMMLIAGFWVRNYGSFSVGVYLALAGMLLLLYYTHVVIFTFTLLIIGIFTFVIFILEWINRKPKAFHFFLIRAAGLFISALPGLVMTGMYLRMLPNSDGGEPAPPFNHWHYFSKSQQLVGFDHAIEDKLGVAVFILFLALMLIIVGWRVYKYLRHKSKYTAASFYSDLWLVLAGIFLTLYVVMPNIMSLKVRLFIVFTLLLIVWFSAQKVPAFISLPIALFMLFLGFRYQQEHIKVYRDSDKVIQKIVGLEQFIEENETIAAFNYGSNWLFYHFQNYLGVEKRIVDLQAAAVSPLFAVEWKQNKPFAFIGTRDAQLVIPYGNTPYSDANTIVSHLIILHYKLFKEVEKTDEKALFIKRDYRLAYISPDEFLAIFSYKHPAMVDSIQMRLNINDPNLIEKAEKYGIPISTVIERDALWLYDQSVSVDKNSEE
jgi:hypothetical protein